MMGWLSGTTPVSNWILIVVAFLLVGNAIGAAARLFGSKGRGSKCQK